ncbi:sigma-54 interaction domain-containing protein [Flectobacillus major]|jgi:transcriptional regulator with PAS, ATPase and Fis domain|uniref:sigma-54 interaction domain-containing protein n=1 Tax=Flectobacillus major TaxID=103 RepID=UPI0004234726|nr:sigma-54 dependent transcriptional regulator [Flectobacillus major]
MTTSELQSIKARFGIIGNSPALNHAIEVAAQVAPTDMTVLITGESGSGKESFSKIIHNISARKHGQFIAVNCGAIPEGTIDSELFGHEKGAFTGAIDARKGYFEVTDGGTIFLDEIAEMPLGTQARLLRVLENGEFIRVGSSKVQRTNVRVVAATNINLMQAVERGKFREDLYYRLNTVPIFVPPLRDRGMDIELLFRKFTTDFAEKYRIKPIQLTPDAQNLLLSQRFPGNIRQLKNLADQVSILEVDDRVLNADKLSHYLQMNNGQQIGNGLVRKDFDAQHKDNFNERELLYKILFDMRRDVTELKKMFLEVLKHNGEVNGDILKGHENLFQNLENDTVNTNFAPSYTAPEMNPNRILPSASSYETPEYQTVAPTENELKIISIDNNTNDVYDITHVAEEVSLSLEKQEKDMIIKALRKNKNKRKYAAQDLGISERTLYRKIKQYDIEEE